MMAMKSALFLCAVAVVINCHHHDHCTNNSANRAIDQKRASNSKRINCWWLIDRTSVQEALKMNTEKGKMRQHRRDTGETKTTLWHSGQNRAERVRVLAISSFDSSLALSSSLAFAFNSEAAKWPPIRPPPSAEKRGRKTSGCGGGESLSMYKKVLNITRHQQKQQQKHCYSYSCSDITLVGGEQTHTLQWAHRHRRRRRR